MNEAVLAVSLLAAIEAVVLMVLLVIVRRQRDAEKCITTVRGVVQSHAMKMQQLHRESVSDLTTFAQMNEHIWRIDHYMSNDLVDRIEELEHQVRERLGEDSNEEKPTVVQARPSSSVHGRGRRQSDAAPRRRRV